MTPRLQLAIDFMKAAHRSIGQKRRDGVRDYEVHPLEVMERVSKATQDEDVLIAALYHDIIEDVYPSRPEIYDATKESAGPRAWGFILELTDTYTKEAFPMLNRRARKQKERERYATFSPEARLVKLADIAANLSDDGGDDADAGFMRMFIREKELCLPYLYDMGDERNYILTTRANLTLEAQKKKFDVR